MNKNNIRPRSRSASPAQPSGISLLETDTHPWLRSIAKHPYWAALLFCLFLNPFFFGSMGNIPNNTCYILTFCLFCAGIFIIRKYYQNHCIPKIAAYAASAGLVPVLLFLAWRYQKAEHKQLWILFGGLAVIFGAVLLMRRWYPKTKLFQTSAVILCSGFILKIYYILCSSIYTRQHDVGLFGYEQEHAGYIDYFLQYHQLPPFDPTTRSQYYHPPLHHIISAIWIDVSEHIFGVGYDSARESLQTLTLFYAIVIIITSYRILRHLKLEGIALYIPLLLISFHPTFILFSGSINNDILATAFVMGAVLCTLQWYEEQTLQRLLKIALCVGLGMMTKMSVALVALPIAFVFCIVLIRRLRQKQWRIFRDYGLFLLVCAPLGLWYPIRNLIRFQIPITYVQRISESSFQYLGNQSFFSRITDFSAYQLQSVYEQWTTYGSSYNEFNPLIAILKNAVFGEYINETLFPGTNAGNLFVNTGTFLFWVNVVLAIVAFLCILLFCFRKCSIAAIPKYFLIIFYFFLMFNVYNLSYKYPFTCSSNFRYIMPTCIIGAIFLGIGVQHMLHSGKTAGKIFSRILLVCAILFALLVSFFYMGIGLYSS